MDWVIWLILALVVFYYGFSFVLKIIDRRKLKKLQPVVRQVVEKINTNLVVKCTLVDEKGEVSEFVFRDVKEPAKKVVE